MARARMLHHKISASVQVNRLSLPAKLLFTWMISHADDEGRLKGDPEYLKATVVPMTNWSPKKITSYLEEMIKQRLIYYWEEESEWYIEFIKWGRHQQIRSDRFKESSLPSFTAKNGNQLDTNGQPNDNNGDPQLNTIQSNPIQSNLNIKQTNDNSSSSKRIDNFVNPHEFTIITDRDEATHNAWSEISSDNPESFGPVFIKARDKGLPVSKFKEFTTKIKQKSHVINPAHDFDNLTEEYFKK